LAKTLLRKRLFLPLDNGVERDCHPLSGHQGIVTHMGNVSAAGPSRFKVVRPSATSSIDAGVSMDNAGPGWYFDPDDVAIYRYWDGGQWTDHRSDTALAPVVASD
jgi:hypothetical protein